MFRLRPKLEVKLNGAISDVQFKPSLKSGIAENVDFRKCCISARARTRTSASFLQENSKLNETRYLSGAFKPSLKCGIAENVDFRKCRISARERTRISASFLQENSKLKAAHHFSGAFKPHFSDSPFRV